MSPSLIDTKQFAKRTGCSIPAIVRMRVEGTGPKFLKIGRSVKYRLSDIEEWLSRRERSSTSEAA